MGEFREVITASGPGPKVYNAYPLLHTAGVCQGQRTETRAKRVVILTRSAFAGQQRNATICWSGDIHSTWDVLAQQIPAALNFSLSGMPYWNSDTGGFFTSAPDDPNYRELFTRWFQFSTFSSILRIHGTSKPKEIWRFDQPIRATLIAFDEMRYHLFPYLYSTSWTVTRANGTMMRALAMDFRSDPKVYDIG